MEATGSHWTREWRALKVQGGGGPIIPGETEARGESRALGRSRKSCRDAGTLHSPPPTTLTQTSLCWPCPQCVWRGHRAEAATMDSSSRGKPQAPGKPSGSCGPWHHPVSEICHRRCWGSREGTGQSPRRPRDSDTAVRADIQADFPTLGSLPPTAGPQRVLRARGTRNWPA